MDIFFSDLFLIFRFFCIFLDIFSSDISEKFIFFVLNFIENTNTSSFIHQYISYVRVLANFILFIINLVISEKLYEVWRDDEPRKCAKTTARGLEVFCDRTYSTYSYC